MNKKNDTKILKEKQNISSIFRTSNRSGRRKLDEEVKNFSQDKLSGLVTNLSYSDLAYSLLCCCKCRRMQFTRKLKQKYVRFKQVEYVSEQFNEDLDWVKITQELKQLRSLIAEVRSGQMRWVLKLLIVFDVKSLVNGSVDIYLTWHLGQASMK